MSDFDDIGGKCEQAPCGKGLKHGNGVIVSSTFDADYQFTYLGGSDGDSGVRAFWTGRGQRGKYTLSDHLLDRGQRVMGLLGATGNGGLDAVSAFVVSQSKQAEATTLRELEAETGYAYPPETRPGTPR